MFARVGDRIVVDGMPRETGRRAGIVVAVRHADGAPPYEVRWLDSGHKSLIFPAAEAEISPRESGGSDAAEPVRQSQPGATVSG